MSETGFHLTDADLELALDALLMGAPDDSGERVAVRALRAIGGVQQRGRWLASVAGLARWRGLLIVATVLAGVVVGFGALRAVQLAFPPAPTPTQSPAASAGPSPSPQPSGTLTTYAHPRDGYSITLTDDWAESDPGAYRSAMNNATLWILAGTTDGRLRACAHGPYSIFGPTPVSEPPCSERVFNSSSDLGAAIQTTAGIGTVEVAGDELILYRRFTFDGYDYVLFEVHDGRPFVMHLTFTYVADAFQVDTRQVTRILQDALSGFAFVP